MQIWSKLYDMLDTEEINELFYSMQDSILEVNKTVFSQGKLDTNLYFINQGQLKIIYQDKAGDVLLYTLGPGQLAGQENFFSNTVCTTSLISLSNVNLKYISKEETARLLLGRRISTAFNTSKSMPGQKIDRSGIIVGVYPFPFEDYSIHVKFDKMLDQSVINAI